METPEPLLPRAGMQLGGRANRPSLGLVSHCGLVSSPCELIQGNFDLSGFVFLKPGKPGGNDRYSGIS